MARKYGTRIQVFRGEALQTTGGLKRGDLTRNSVGKIVSKKKQTQGKRSSNLGRYLVRTKRERRKRKNGKDMF